MRALRRPLLLTQIGLVAERLTRAFWPLWSLGFVLWTAFSFGALERLSIEFAFILTLAGAVGVIAFAIRGIISFHWPDRAVAADRLDRSLKNRPLSALWDSQAIGAGDAASTMLWRAHVARMAEEAEGVKPVEPDLKISDRDPYGLRFMAVIGLVLALLFAPMSSKNRLQDLLDPDGGSATAAGPVYEGWIEPPHYTGLPGIYLNEVSTAAPLPIPQGSKVTLRIYAAPEEASFEESVSGEMREDSVEQAIEFIVTQSGVLRITGDQPKNWRIDMVPDTPPLVAITGPIERTPQGEMTLSFEAADDYGVRGGSVEIDLDLNSVEPRFGQVLLPESRPAITLDMPLPYSSDNKMFTDKLVEDLSKHPWSGLPVTVTMRAFDDLDQVAIAEPEQVILPGRRFFDPLAAAIVEQRRDLLWNRLNAKRVTQVLRAISYLPEQVFDNERAYLVLRAAIRRMEYSQLPKMPDALRDDVSEMLWRAALLIEDGNLSDAEQRLKRAEDRLAEALENGATDEEVAELLQELRRAMQEYLEQIARENDENPPSEQADNRETREITSDELQEMLDRIQELAREGRTAEAQELLEQLRQMMENMETARREQGEGQGEGQQSMRDLADTMRQQQSLSDEAFRQLQEQFNQPGQQEGGDPGQSRSGQGRQGEGQPGEFAEGQVGPLSPSELANRQEALRELLESQRQGLPNSNSDAGRRAREALNRAEREMGEAGNALRQGDLPQALDNQAEALEALRNGLENLGQELAENQNNNSGRQGDQAGSPDPNSERDPLGRRTGTRGRVGSEDNLLTGQDPILRSRELLEEIRRRSGDKSRPRIELDYLERLLDRF